MITPLRNLLRWTSRRSLDSGRRTVNSKKIFLVLVYLFSIFGVLSTIIVMAAYVDYKISRENTPSQQVPTPSSSPSPSTKISDTFPETNTWIEYVPKCEAFKRNVNFYVPGDWKVTGEMPAWDGTSDERGSKEYEDFMNLISHCQILLGYKNMPGGPQDPAGEGVYGVIYISAREREENSSTLESIKNELLKTYPYSVDKPEYIYKGQINGMNYLYNEIPPYSAIWYFVSSEGFEIRISMFVPDFDSQAPLLNGYIKKTVFELLQKIEIK